MKKIQSIKSANLTENIIYGFSWIIVGFFGLFNNLICAIFEMIFLLIVSVSLLYSLFHKREKDDEMSVSHRTESRAKTLKLLLFVMFLLWIVVDIQSISSSLGIELYSLSFETIAPFLIGFCYFSEGIIFAQLERGSSNANIED